MRDTVNVKDLMKEMSEYKARKIMRQAIELLIEDGFCFYKGTCRRNRSIAHLFRVKRYNASGFGLSRINRSASVGASNVSTGSTGPNISSCITASAAVTLSSIVGCIFSVSASAPPPNTTFSGSISPQTRRKCFSFIILP